MVCVRTNTHMLFNRKTFVLIILMLAIFFIDFPEIDVQPPVVTPLRNEQEFLDRGHFAYAMRGAGWNNQRDALFMSWVIAYYTNHSLLIQNFVSCKHDAKQYNVTDVWKKESFSKYVDTHICENCWIRGMVGYNNFNNTRVDDRVVFGRPQRFKSLENKTR
eukprot:UN26253